MPDLHAEVDIIERYSQLFIKAPCFLKYRSLYHHACRSDCTDLLDAYHTPHITDLVPRCLAHDMPCDPAKAHDHTCMLDGVIRIIKLGSYSSHTFLLTDLKHFLHPGGGDDLHVIVQKQKVLASCLFYCEIIDGRIVEFFFPGKDSYVVITVLKFLVISKCFFLFAVILHNQDFIILPGGPFFDGRNTQFQVFHMVFIGNNEIIGSPSIFT